MSKNRAILIIVIVVAVVLVGLAVFYFFFRGEAVPPPPDVIYPVGPELPFGGTSTTTPGTGGGYINQPQTFAQTLRLVSSLPVSGATLYEKNKEVFVRYVERANGHIYETPALKKDAPYRISNTTIPKIYEAYWTQNGEGVVLRYLKEGSDDIQTFYAALKPSSTSTEQGLADGTFLPNNVSILVVSPAQDKIFYLLSGIEGSVGIRSNPNGTQKSQLFSSPAHEWLVSWPQARTVALSTKPSAGVPGALFFLDTSSGALKKVIGGVKGLTALPNSDASLVLFSDSSTALKLLNVAKQTISDVGLGTLPEKCAWSRSDSEVIYCAVPDTIPSAEYPDAWYQGRVSFTDNLWRVNTNTGQTSIVLTPQSVAKTTMDITGLVLSENDDYLLFTNKKDLSLWLLDVDAVEQ